MKYTLQQDKHDWRDIIYQPTNTELQPSADLRKWASPVENQLDLNSCVSNAVTGSYQLLINKEAPHLYNNLSRLFLYYNGRVMEGTVDQDTGLTMRDGIKSVEQCVLCKESLWPYNVNNYNVKPPPESYVDATSRNIKQYSRITDLNGILDAVNNDKPVNVGIAVYSNFELIDAENSILTTDNNAFILGGHAVCIVGYNLQQQLVLARNSFGEQWGIQGYFWITFDYMNRFLMDSWVFDIAT